MAVFPRAGAADQLITATRGCVSSGAGAADPARGLHGAGVGRLWRLGGADQGPVRAGSAGGAVCTVHR